MADVAQCTELGLHTIEELRCVSGQVETLPSHVEEEEPIPDPFHDAFRALANRATSQIPAVVLTTLTIFIIRVSVRHSARLHARSWCDSQAVSSGLRPIGNAWNVDRGRPCRASRARFANGANALLPRCLRGLSGTSPEAARM